MGKLIIIGSTRPVIGTKEMYSVSSANDGLYLTNMSLQPPKVEWGIMVQTKTGWQRAKNDKEGETVPYTFGQKSLLHREIKIVVQQGKDKSELIVHPQRAKEPRISKVELLDANYQPIPKGRKISYKDTIIARAYGVEMFKMRVSFALWEDDAQGEGHNPIINALNRVNLVPIFGTVNEKGVAEAVFRLRAYTMAVQIANARTASGDKDEGAVHEYYVTAEMASRNIQKASPNVNVINPTYNPPPPRQREMPTGHSPLPEKSKPIPPKAKPKEETAKFPQTSAAKKQADPEGKILSAEFTDGTGKPLRNAQTGDGISIKIIAQNMKGKNVKVRIWEEDFLKWSQDLLYEKSVQLIGNTNFINDITLTKDMFAKGYDVGDKNQLEYFIEVEHNNTSVTSAVMNITVDASQTEVPKGRSALVVKDQPQSKHNENKCPNCEKNITLDQIKKIFPDCKDETKLKEAMNAYNKYMEKFHMNTCWNKAHFFAQTRIESGTSLNYKNESFNYSTRRLIQGDYTSGFVKGNLEKKIPGYHTTGKFNKRPFAYFDNHHDEAEKLGRKDVYQNNDGLIQKADSEIIANLAYGPNSAKGKELKNTQDGDGWLYRGRGFIQITGKYNYGASNKYTQQYARVEILSNDGANKVGTNAEIAMLACMGYWIADDRKIQNIANGEKNEDKISKLIGTNVDWEGKKKAFDEITSKLFKVNECIYGVKEDDAKKGDKNQYDIDIDNFKFKMITTKPDSNDYEYNVYVAGKKIKTYKLKKNSHGLIPFPESGPNWGRFGTRDNGGDNWINEKICAALLGFFYSLPDHGYSSTLYFNDISANNGRNIGHAGHNIAGNDIDIRYPGSTNGGQTLWRDAMKAYKDETTFIRDLENIISVGVKWKFIKNYAYKKEIKNTTGKATGVHQDHFHLGYR